MRDGLIVADPARDLLKMASHRPPPTAAHKVSFIQGIGLRSGAWPAVAHDHHNLVVIGADDDSMLATSGR